MIMYFILSRLIGPFVLNGNYLPPRISSPRIVFFDNPVHYKSQFAMEDKVIIEPSAKHTATVIFFHGRGDTGHGWAQSLAEEMPPYIKIICPTAQNIPVKMISGALCRAWFNLSALDPSAEEDNESIQKAASSVHSLIEDEIKAGIPSNRIVIGGFSQGGALSLYSSLCTKYILAGVVSLSCWLPLRGSLSGYIAGNTETPILMCHNDNDPHVPHRWALESAEILRKFNKSFDFRTYKNRDHFPCKKQMEDVKIFIERCLPNL